jgi:uncharacterized membrane protein YfcA
MVSQFDGSLETWRVVLVSTVVLFVTMFAVAAGIGGGGLLVPIYAYVLGLGPQLAVPVSKATIFGVAVGNVFYISREKHPKANRPLIDYPTAVLMQGGELLGVVIGVLFNLLLSEAMIIILLVVVLGFNAYKTLGKGVQKWKAETRAMAATKTSARTSSDLQSVEMQMPQVAEGAQPSVSSPAPDHEINVEEPRGADPQPAEVTLLLTNEATQFPLWAWAALLGMASFIVLYSFLLAGFLAPELDLCHSGYWPTYVTPFVFYGLLMLMFARRNVRQHQAKVACGFPLAEGDIVWTPRAAMMLCPAAVGAGAAAGLLGIGGGMILGPIFVALDFQPQVGTATTGFMILFTAFGGTVKYLAVGKLPWRYLLWFGCIGALGGQVGQRVVKKVLLRTGRPSIVVLLLGSIIGLAVIVMASMGVTDAVSRAQGGQNLWELDTTQFECVQLAGANETSGS